MPPGELVSVDEKGGGTNYDLVVCVCGHVNLRHERSAHMKVQREHNEYSEKSEYNWYSEYTEHSEYGEHSTQ